MDPEHLIESAMRALHDWSGQRVLDVGCGSGFHLPLFARTAASVVGVEPHSPLVELARERLAALGPAAGEVEVLEGAAQELPLEDCLGRRGPRPLGVLLRPRLRARPGRAGAGAAPPVAPPSSSTTTRRARPSAAGSAGPCRTTTRWRSSAFWTRQGWSRERIDTRWAFDSRETFESVVRIEFPPTIADGILAEHEGTGVDYAVNLWWRTFP